MKALVTGGSGFIGSNIVCKLLAEGWQVRILDDLSSGYKENLVGLDVEFINGDVRDAQTCDVACKGIDIVFHLAASVGRQRSLDFPAVDAAINLGGTVNILESMRKNRVSKIVYSSSAAIFGELITQTIAEDHPQNPDSPYGVTKLAAEKMILAQCGIYGMTGVCLRYFNIYGVHQRFDMYGNVIPIFAERISQKEPLTIYGDGEQTRDFLNVKDVATANYLAAVKGGGSGVFNLGSGTSITINELAKTMLAITKQNVPIIHAPERPADVRHCKANTTEAELVLGFRPSVDLSKGLEEYLQWYTSSGQNDELK